jgi:DNA-binding LytR/AlgR family response regulator
MEKPFEPPATSTLTADETVLQTIVYLEDGKVLHRLERSNILGFKVQGKYIEVRTRDQRIVIRRSLSELLKQLNDPHLRQVNRNTVVNVLYLQRISPDEVEVAGDVVPLSRNYRAGLMKHLQVLAEGS